MKQIHIVGVGPRTGTTLLAEAMSTCFNVDYSTDHEDRIFVRPTRKTSIYLSKHPADLFVIWPSLIVDPNLFVICIVRDPRDSIVSKHNKDGSRYWSGLRYWKSFIPLIKKYQKHKRFISIRYEDFVNNPDEIQQYILSKIACLKLRYNFSEYHLYAKPSEESTKALKNLRPIDNSGIGNWKNHLPRVKQQMLIHGDISDSLTHYKYETDSSWQIALENETIYEGKSHWPEFFSKADLIRRKKYKYIEAARRVLSNIGFLRSVK